MSIVTRFAPSPTGYLHLGHAASALTGFAAARAGQGDFLLRIEDIDAGRCRPAFTEAIIEDLTWLGLVWRGEVRRQSDHLADYAAALDRLVAMDLLYPCFCTRAEIAAAMSAPHGGDGRYPGTCRTLDPAMATARIAQGDAYALRLRTDRAVRRTGALRFHEAGEGWISADPEALGDVVLARKDALCSYHLCVTHDDAAQGVTLVTRGQDLRAVTPIHVLLQHLLGWPTPAYAHHPLLTDQSGRRLAKRDRAATLREMRQAGVTPAGIVKIISCRIGDITSL
jgi:Glutamyl- and glutaminyl-tRNA synthetases